MTEEVLPGHQRKMVTLINMRGAHVNNDRVKWVAGIAKHRGTAAVLMSEFGTFKRPPKWVSGTNKRKRDEDIGAERGGPINKAPEEEANSTGDQEQDEGYGTDMSDTDDEEDDNRNGVVMEMTDPAASCKPKIIRRREWTLVYGFGAGVMLFDKELREQLERRMGNDTRRGRFTNNVDAAIRSKRRVMAMFLDEVVLVAAYSPTEKYKREEQDLFDTNFVKIVREIKRRKSEKWKLRVIGGDWNCRIGRDEFGESSVHVGEGGANETNAKGRRFAKVLMGGNLVMVNSNFKAHGEKYATHEKGNELDFFVTTGGGLQKFRTYQRLNFNAPGANGKQRAPRKFDHLAVETAIDIKTKAWLKQEGEVRKLATMEIMDNISEDLRRRYNEDLRQRIAEQGEGFRLEEFQDYLVEYLPEMMGKRRQRSRNDVPDPEQMAENASCRANMWKMFREMKANEAAAGGVGGAAEITPEQARVKYDEVGNSPLVPDGQELPIAGELEELVPRLSDETIEGLDRPVTAKELRAAVMRLKAGGRARDKHGLGADLLMHFDDETLEVLTGVLVRELAGRNISELEDRMHLCRDVPLYKGKGDRTDAGNYRFLVVSPMLLKLIVKIKTDRLYDALEAAEYFSATQYGFRRGRGCIDSLTLFNRMREDLKHYRYEAAMRTMVVLVDLRKAFPSLDWRLVTGVMTALGIAGTKTWEVLNASHRSARHGFGGELFDLRHGCKEGCPSSPLIFITTFAAVMKKYTMEMEKRHGNEKVGLSLQSNRAAWHWPREDKIFALVRCGHDSSLNLMDLLFADDTTLVEQTTAEIMETITEMDIEAKKKDQPGEDCGTTAVFTRVISQCGLRENVGKRIRGDIVEIVARNLGVSTDPDEDVRLKILKAWKAVWTLRSRVSGLEGITNKRRGELILVMIRSIMMYGLQARAVSEREIRLLHREENRILGQMLDIKWWERKAYDLHYADLRRRTRLPPLRVHVKFLQARYFAHVMRGPREAVTREALIGKFFPMLIQGEGDVDLAVELLRSEKNVKQLEPRKRIMPDMLADMLKHLTHDCRMPVQLLHLLFESLEETKSRRPDLGPQGLYGRNKATFYGVTRQWFISETAKDWARGCAWTREWAADLLAEQYFGDKKNKLMTRDQIRRKAARTGDDPDQMVAQHFRPRRNGAEKTLRGEECIWCSKIVKQPGGDDVEILCDPVERMALSNELKEHLQEEHAITALTAQGITEKEELTKKAKTADAQRGEEIRCEIVEELVATGDVTEVQQRGPKRPGRSTYVRKLRCNICCIAFTTSAGSMKLHMEAHKRGDYIKIGQLCQPMKGYVDDEERKMREEFRPEQHAVNSNGQYYYGSDARLYRIDVPEEARHVDPRSGKRCIRCRICGEKTYEYDEQIHNTKSCSHRVTHMRKHEEACRKKKAAAEAAAAAAKKRKIDKKRPQHGQ